MAKDSIAHELALNPDTFTERSDESILSTLVHEMCHAWEHTHGKVPRRGYHDKQSDREDEADRAMAIEHR